jgi:hypothetical protein
VKNCTNSDSLEGRVLLTLYCGHRLYIDKSNLQHSSCFPCNRKRHVCRPFWQCGTNVRLIQISIPMIHKLLPIPTPLCPNRPPLLLTRPLKLPQQQTKPQLAPLQTLKNFNKICKQSPTLSHITITNRCHFRSRRFRDLVEKLY